MNDLQNLPVTKKFSGKKLLALLGVAILAVVGIGGYAYYKSNSNVSAPPTLEMNLTSLAQGKLSTRDEFAALPPTYGYGNGSCTGGDILLKTNVNHLFATKAVTMKDVSEALKFDGSRGQYLVAFFTPGDEKAVDNSKDTEGWYLYPTKSAPFTSNYDVNTISDEDDDFTIPAYRGFQVIVNNSETTMCGNNFQISSDLTPDVWKTMTKNEFTTDVKSFPEGWVMVPMLFNEDTFMAVAAVFEPSTTSVYLQNDDNDFARYNGEVESTGYSMMWLNLGSKVDFDSAAWDIFDSVLHPPEVINPFGVITMGSSSAENSVELTITGTTLGANEKYYAECKGVDGISASSAESLTTNVLTVSALQPGTSYTCTGFVKASDGTVKYSTPPLGIDTLGGSTEATDVTINIVNNNWYGTSAKPNDTNVKLMDFTLSTDSVTPVRVTGINFVASTGSFTIPMVKINSDSYPNVEIRSEGAPTTLTVSLEVSKNNSPVSVVISADLGSTEFTGTISATLNTEVTAVQQVGSVEVGVYVVDYTVADDNDAPEINTGIILDDSERADLALIGIGFNERISYNNNGEVKFDEKVVGNDDVYFFEDEHTQGFAISVPRPTETKNYEVQISGVTDLAGNPLANNGKYSLYYTPTVDDKTPPKIKEDGVSYEIDVDGFVIVTLEFTEIMSTKERVEVMFPDSNGITGEVLSRDRESVMFRYNNKKLLPGTYKGFVYQGSDVAGNEIDPAGLEFTVTIEGTPPEVVGASYTSGTVSVQFNEAVKLDEIYSVAIGDISFTGAAITLDSDNLIMEIEVGVLVPGSYDGVVFGVSDLQETPINILKSSFEFVVPTIRAPRDPLQPIEPDYPDFIRR